MNKLTSLQVKNAKCRDGKERIFSDGAGLYLKVSPNLSNTKLDHKVWIFRFKSPTRGKRRTKGLGSYPYYSLVEARQKRDECHQILKLGLDPIDKETSEKNAPSLEQVAKQWLDNIKRPVVVEDTANDILKSLELHVFPRLGAMPIQNISAKIAHDELIFLQEAGKLETLRRICSRLDKIMIYAVNKGVVEFNCLANLSDSFTAPVPKSLPTIAPKELGCFLKVLSNAQIQRTTRCQIEWALHVMLRPGECAAARWDEIDFENAVWVIAGMKMKNIGKAIRDDFKEHLVPLSKQSLKILEVMKPISGHRDYIFPGRNNPNTHIDSQSANSAIKKMGYKDKLVSHGIRKIASTYLNEQGFNSDHIEKGLAHKDKDKIRAIYNMAEYLEPRRVMMQAWSDFIQSSAQKEFVSLLSHTE